MAAGSRVSSLGAPAGVGASDVEDVVLAAVALAEVRCVSDAAAWEPHHPEAPF